MYVAEECNCRYNRGQENAVEALFADFQSLLSMSREKAEKNIQEALNYLRLDFRNLGILIGQYHPLEVLKMAAWEERRMSRTKARDPLAAATGRLLPVLLQSVVQSTVYDVSNGISSNRNIKEKDWQRIKSLSEDVAKRIIRSIECYTVLAVHTGKITEENALKYRELLFIEAFPPVEDLENVERLSYMTYAAMHGSEVTYNALADIAGKMKFVPKDDQRIKVARSIGIAFGDGR